MARRRSTRYIAEAKQLIQTNQLWINWAISKKPAQGDALEKSVKSVKPR